MSLIVPVHGVPVRSSILRDVATAMERMDPRLPVFSQQSAAKISTAGEEAERMLVHASGRTQYDTGLWANRATIAVALRTNGRVCLLLPSILYNRVLTVIA